MTDIATPDTETLRTTLEGLRLRGAIFFRAEYTEDWAYESPTAADLATILAPGRDRLTLFHIVASGSCTVILDQGQSRSAQAGDVIVLPYGHRHVMHGRSSCDEVTSITSLMDPPPWTSLPVVRHGGGGARTDVVCGYLVSDDPLFDPGLAALPDIFVVRPEGPAADWMRASITYAMEGAPSGQTRPRLAELLLVEVLRTHLSSLPNPAVAEGRWLTALRDPVLAPALAAVHRHPGHRWTVAELAEKPMVSRSTLDQRFRDLLGISPMRYLADWRMHVAENLLQDTTLTVAAIADSVGYEAVEAFSRAFRRRHGIPPADWRAAHTTAS